MPQNGTGYTEGRFQLARFAKFNRPDPMRDWDWLRPHTLNLYEYVGNDPVNMWDPTGLEQETTSTTGTYQTNIFKDDENTYEVGSLEYTRVSEADDGVTTVRMETTTKAMDIKVTDQSGTTSHFSGVKVTNKTEVVILPGTVFESSFESSTSSTLTKKKPLDPKIIKDAREATGNKIGGDIVQKATADIAGRGELLKYLAPIGLAKYLKNTNELKNVGAVVGGYLSKEAGEHFKRKGDQKARAIESKYSVPENKKVYKAVEANE